MHLIFQNNMPKLYSKNSQIWFSLRIESFVCVCLQKCLHFLDPINNIPFWQPYFECNDFANTVREQKVYLRA